MEMVSHALSGVLPPSAENLLLAFVAFAALGGWALSGLTSRSMAREVIPSGVSPPDPLGVRLIV
jgi:hypothetical protein